MKHLITLVLFAGTALVSIGCAPHGSGAEFSLENPTQGTTLIYLYRPGSFIGSAIAWDVASQGKLVTRIGNGGYYAHLAQPGNVDYRAKRHIDTGIMDVLGTAIDNSFQDFDPAYNMTAAEGETHFLRWTVVEMKPKIVEVDKATAVSEMRGLKSWPAASNPTKGS